VGADVGGCASATSLAGTTDPDPLGAGGAVDWLCADRAAEDDDDVPDAPAPGPGPAGFPE